MVTSQEIGLIDWKALDTNGDGKVSAAEQLPLFSVTPKNPDDIVSAATLANAFANSLICTNGKPPFLNIYQRSTPDTLPQNHAKEIFIKRLLDTLHDLPESDRGFAALLAASANPEANTIGAPDAIKSIVLGRMRSELPAIEVAIQAWKQEQKTALPGGIELADAEMTCNFLRDQATDLLQRVKKARE